MSPCPARIECVCVLWGHRRRKIVRACITNVNAGYTEKADSSKKR